MHKIRFNELKTDDKFMTILRAIQSVKIGKFA